MRRIATATALISAAAFLLAAPAPSFAAGTNGPAHAIAMHGQPKYGPDFAHFDYVNPNAPKGGMVIRDATGTYDSLNPFIIGGNPAAGLGLIYQALTTASADEAFTRYCLICETMEVPDDRSWTEFTLREDARWHDGRPITVDDVIFSFTVLRDQGAPFYRFYYNDIATPVQTGPRSVRFNFNGGTNLELPLIIGEMTILPKHYWESREFAKTTLEPPLGSGPYRVSNVKPGRSITFERVADYWGIDHPANVGFNNFDVVRFDYFRDRTVAREAFKGGETDLWIENTAKDWATAFDVPAVRDGMIHKEEIPHERVAGMQGFVFNTRRSLFEDRRVRRALSYAFDFEWSNANLFNGAYTRTRSYFDNSELAATGLLADATPRDREILERYRDRLPPEIFTEEFVPPQTDGSGNRGIRNNLRTAREMLAEAGWVIRDGKLVNAATAAPFKFEILIVSPAFERIALPYTRNLERLGIDANVRLVDSSQYQNRLDSYDFDMVVGSWGQSESPGNEQRDYWGGDAATRDGTRNLAGIQDPVIDELIDAVIAAPDRESLVSQVRALDRVLQWGHYIVPQWHVPHDRIAFWDKFGRPAITPARGTQIFAWWIEAEREQNLALRRTSSSTN